MARLTGPEITTPGLAPAVMIVSWNIVELALDFHTAMAIADPLDRDWPACHSIFLSVPQHGA